MKYTFIKLYISILCFVSGASLLSAEPIRIMPLGDSITYDNNKEDLINPRSASERHSYRNHLWYKLQNVNYNADFVGSLVAGQSIEPSFDPDNEGHSGWGINDIFHNILSFLHTSKPNIILLHIGTNNGSSPYPDNINLILDEIDYYEHTTEEKVKVIVALIINTQDNDYTTRLFNKRLNQILVERIIVGDNIQIVDMYRGAGLTIQDYSDRLHPNDSGYEKMANVWFNTLNSSEPNPSLYSYPYTHMSKYNIESITVDGNTDTVHYIANIPDDGITF